MTIIHECRCGEEFEDEGYYSDADDERFCSKACYERAAEKVWEYYSRAANKREAQ